MNATLDTLPASDRVWMLDTLSLLAEKEVRLSKGWPGLAAHPVSRAAPVEVIWLQAKINALKGKISPEQMLRLENRLTAFVGPANEGSVVESEGSMGPGATSAKTGRRAKTWQNRSWMRGDTVHPVKTPSAGRRRALGDE